MRENTDLKKRRTWTLFTQWMFAWALTTSLESLLIVANRHLSYLPANMRLDEDVFRLRLQKTSSRRDDQDEYIRLTHTSSEDILINTNIIVLVIRLQDVLQKRP